MTTRHFQTDRMIRTVLWTCLILSMTSPSRAKGEEAVAQIELMQTGEPARVYNPACAVRAELSAADVILKAGAALIDDYIGVPITSAVIDKMPPGNKNWLKARLGIHGGPAHCASLCVTYPSNAQATLQACLSETGGDGAACYETDSDYPWGRVEHFTTEDTNNGTSVFCAHGKNWSHNHNRWFAVKATW